MPTYGVLQQALTRWFFPSGGHIPLTVDANTLMLYHMDGAAASAAKQLNAQGNAALNLAEVTTPTAQTGTVTPTANGAYGTTSTAYVQCPNNAALNVSALTVEGWIKTTASNIGLCARYTGAGNRTFRFLITAGGKLQVIFYDNADNNSAPISSTTTVNDGNWHYFAVTFGAGTISVYVDPASTTPQATTALGSINASASPFVIGGNAIEGFGTHNFDEVRYSDTARTGSEIYNYYLGVTSAMGYETGGFMPSKRMRRGFGW